jgi:hypothetical protein
MVLLRKRMHLLRQYIQEGEVYRRSDLDYFSTAIDRHLAQLTEEGTLVKLSHGLYYAPKQSKFGVLPPDEKQLIGRFLQDEDFLLVSPNSFNSLGLGLTQLYNTTWVYNHKRNGEVKLNGKTFEFKRRSSFPKAITREFLLVDLLNSLEDLAESTTSILEILPNCLSTFDTGVLLTTSQKYGTGKTNRILKTILRNTLQYAGFHP